MKLFFSIAFFLITLTSKAQNDSSDKYKIGSLYYKEKSFNIYPKVMINGKKLKKNETIVLFNKIPAASIFYKKYRNKYNAGLYSFVGFFVSTAISTISFDNGNRTLTGIGLTLSIFSFTNAIIFISSGEANLRKAIKTYNKHVLRY